MKSVFFSAAIACLVAMGILLISQKLADNEYESARDRNRANTACLDRGYETAVLYVKGTVACGWNY